MKNEKYRIGLDMGASSIKLVTWHTRKKQEKFRLMKELNLLEEFNLHEISEIDDTHIMEGIKIVMNSVPKSRASIRVSVSDPVNNLFCLDIPTVNKNEMDDVIAWSLGPYLPLPVEDYEKDYKVIEHNNGKKSHKVLIGTFEKSRLTMVKKAFKRAGMSIDILTSDQLALADLYMNLNKDQTRPVGILDLGASSTKYSIISNEYSPAFLKTGFGSDEIDRVMAHTIGISPSGARSLRFGDKSKNKINNLPEKIDEAYKDALKVVNDFTRDLIMYNLDYETKTGSGIEKVFITGGLALDEWLISNLMDLFSEGNIESSLWEPAKERFINEQEDDHGITRFSTALGLALL